MVQRAPVYSLQQFSIRLSDSAASTVGILHRSQNHGKLMMDRKLYSVHVKHTHLSHLSHISHTLWACHFHRGKLSRIYKKCVIQKTDWDFYCFGTPHLGSSVTCYWLIFYLLCYFFATWGIYKKIKLIFFNLPIGSHPWCQLRWAVYIKDKNRQVNERSLWGY